MSVASLEATFVQRTDMVERLSALLGGLRPGSSTHNVLLVGPRGIGKSHLIALIHARVSEGETSKQLAVAYLREDEWGIGSFLDLLIRITDSIAEYLELASPLSDLALYKLEAQEAESTVWARLQKMVDRRPIVAIIENLDTIFAGIEESGQRKWRALIQNTGQWSVLATTPALFPQVSEQVSPFYGFFEVTHLQPLDLTEAVELMRRLAVADRDTQTAEFVISPIGRARIKAVQHLAGGNHRIFVVFYDFLRQETTQEFITPLLKTIDALTPYYQSMMARLSPQQQKIINLLCESGKPANVTTIAQRCLISHQTAASQLRQLLGERYVRVNRTGREAYYELAEPLLRICVEVKSHRREPLRLLVDFIRFWFSREELEQKILVLGPDEFGRDYFQLALSKYSKEDKHEHLDPEIATLCAFLGRHDGESPEVLSKAQELCELSRIAEDWSHFTIAKLRLHKPAEVIPVITKELEREPNDANLLDCLARAYGDFGDYARALEILDRALAVSPNSSKLLYDKAVILARQDSPDDQVIAVLEEVILHEPDSVYARLDLALVHLRNERLDKAFAVLTDILKYGEVLPKIFTVYGMTLLELSKNEEALLFLEKATSLMPNDMIALSKQAEALTKLGRSVEALEVLDRVLTRDPHQRWAASARCRILMQKERYDLICETVSPEIVAHQVFHQLREKASQLDTVKAIRSALINTLGASTDAKWKEAVYGGIVELASSFKELDFVTYGNAIRLWRDAVKIEFTESTEYHILVDIFDVLVRMNSGDPQSILELPLEQRRLLVTEQEEEKLLTTKKASVN